MSRVRGLILEVSWKLSAFLQAVWELSFLQCPSGGNSSNLLGRSPRTVGASGLSLAAPCWLRPNCSGSKDCLKQPSSVLDAVNAKKINQSYPLLFLSNREIKSFSSKWLLRAVAILEKPIFGVLVVGFLWGGGLGFLVWFVFVLVLQPLNIRKRGIPLSPLAPKNSLVLAALWLVAELSSFKERKRDRKQQGTQIPRVPWVEDYHVKRQNKTNRKFHLGQTQL